MPRIDDEESIATKRPFKKKPYRPWNLLDDEFDNAIIPVETLSNNKVTNMESYSNQIVINEEPVSNQIVTKYTEKVNKQGPISNQTSNQISNQSIANKACYSTSTEQVERITGLQRKILFYIVEDCILRGALSSQPISAETLKKITNADKNTVKTATQRLINKKLISRGQGKKGKGGFAIFYINEDIRGAVIEIQKREIQNNRLVTNWVSNKEPLSTYSSSSYIKTTTKAGQPEELIIDEGSSWDRIDMEPLSHIGFSKNHLRQIILDDKLSFEIVQDSIYSFAFDLQHNGKEKNLRSSPLNYFMGILRSGKPYAAPANYESPQDKAMREYLERKNEIESRRKAMEEELLKQAYAKWEKNMSPIEKESILPDNVKRSRLISDKVAYLRTYFKEQVWPTIKHGYTLV